MEGWELLSLVTIESKHIHALNTSVGKSLMVKMLGRVEINDGVTKYYGSDGRGGDTYATPRQA
ncbi:MAG: hypothetical protein CM15mP106_1220 [Candidatus Neomarinimicrobiota bacterium]|nr:MAG: hypothetical protein CM15mP106_1220 [Candidatus Neomarinimicrobiota bacterium]